MEWLKKLVWKFERWGNPPTPGIDIMLIAIERHITTHLAEFEEIGNLVRDKEIAKMSMAELVEFERKVQIFYLKYCTKY